MKKGLLGSTALIGATALMAGAAGAAEAPTYKLTGNTNFQIYIPSGDVSDVLRDDASIFFGVDEAELQLNVSGTADNGLEYGFKIELNANTTDGSTPTRRGCSFRAVGAPSRWVTKTAPKTS